MVLSPETVDGRIAPAARRTVTGRGTAAALTALVLLFAAPCPSPAGTCLKATPLFEITGGGDVAFRQPSDITVREDRLFVLDDLNGRAAAFSLEGRYLSSVTLPTGSGTSSLGIDLGGDDNLYVASSGEGKIVVVSQGGRKIREFPTGGGEGPTEPTGVKISRGRCLVVDNEAHQVKVFDLKGQPLAQWGELGEGSLGLRYPFRLVEDSLGRIVVSDSLNSRIKVFTPAGEPLLEFGVFGVTEGTLFRPAGLALWGADSIMVGDNYHGAVQLFSAGGEYRGTLCGGDGTPILFDNPVGLASRDPLLFVLEMGAGRVRAFEVR